MPTYKIKDNLLEEYGVNIPHMIGFKQSIPTSIPEQVYNMPEEKFQKKPPPQPVKADHFDQPHGLSEEQVNYYRFGPSTPYQEPEDLVNPYNLDLNNDLGIADEEQQNANKQKDKSKMRAASENRYKPYTLKEYKEK